MKNGCWSSYGFPSRRRTVRSVTLVSSHNNRSHSETAGTATPSLHHTTSYRHTSGDWRRSISHTTLLATHTPAVTAAGNLARRHWRTPLDDTGHAVEDAARLRVTEPATVHCWLTVRDGPATPSAYGLRLEQRDQARTVARATPYDADDVPNLRLVDRLFPGIYRPVPAGPSGATVDVTTVHHRLLGGDTDGSIAAPTTAPGVLSVGAVRDGEPARFSSRGGTETTVDVLGPGRVLMPPVGPFEGTSAAAAAVGGVVALARGTSDASAETLTRALRRTAREVGAGVDPTSPTGPAGVESVATGLTPGLLLGAVVGAAVAAVATGAVLRRR